jgi:3-methyl-2-oxobutanoate hydroxymethyltransferase
MDGNPIRVPDFKKMKRRAQKITMLTAYDATMARLFDRAGVDALLVGDSLGMVVLGYDTTLPVTLEAMIHHTSAVSRGTEHALVVADMPFLSYQVTVSEAVRNAGRLLQEGGAAAVKLEGGRPMLDVVRRLVDAGIPVMGHLGLTPQTATALGGHKAQGRQAEAAERLFMEAVALEQAGCFAMVLEAVPAPVAAAITGRVGIPTIGIGSGSGTDGQVLVLHDMLGIPGDGPEPRFVKRYAEIGELMGAAVAAYAMEVRSHVYPAEEHTYTIPAEELEAFQNAVDAGSIEENTLADW